MPAPLNLHPYTSVAAFFGAELRRHRERLGWTQEHLAARLTWSLSLITKIERTERLPPDGFGAACDRVFGLPGVLEHLEDLVHRAPNWFTRFMELEAQASRINIWDTRVAPGLLQTPDYARAVLTATSPFASAQEIEEALADRMARHTILERPEAPMLNVFLHESVVRQAPTDPAILQRQLGRLLDLAESSRVNLRILPFSTGCVAGATGAFAIFEFTDQPPVGSIEGRGGGNMVDGNELAEMSCVFDHIGAAALTAEQTTGLLRGALTVTWSDPIR